MKLTNLSEAPGETEAPPRAFRRFAAVRTGSQLIPSVRQTIGVVRTKEAEEVMLVLDAPPGPQTPAEAEGLHAITVRRRWVWGWFLGGIVTVLAAGALHVADRVMFVAVPIWIVLWGVLLLWNARARCPRCHRLFSNTWLGGNHFAKHCVHCGLSFAP